jgi:aspartyl-tRNA(Asn)/glutamyl-tRNA(Gln) amidotransferase subunit C
MKITSAEVDRIALLARLRLTQAEQAQLADDLHHILTYMDKLGEVDTAIAEPFTHESHLAGLREDRVTNRPNAEVILAQAPDRDGSFFKVPKIIE